ncbi:MAG: hypothetical protein ACFFE8_03050 [Candidatus Heimdallarchaeota archaeon]
MSFEMFFRELESVKPPKTSQLLCKCQDQGKGEVWISPSGSVVFSDPCSKDNPCYIICCDSKRFSTSGKPGKTPPQLSRTTEEKQEETRRFLERLFCVPPHTRDNLSGGY